MSLVILFHFLCAQHVSDINISIIRSLRPGHYSNLTAPNLQNTVNQDRNDQCGNQQYSRQLLMVGIVMHETC